MSEFEDILEDDLDIFFNEDEFGVAATHKPKGGADKPTTVVFVSGDNQVEDQRGNHASAVIQVKRSSIGIPKYNDIFEIDNVNWRVVREVHRDKWVVHVKIRSDLRGNYSQKRS